MRYLVFIIALFAAVQTNAQNNIVYGAGINYTNGAPTFTPAVRTSRVAIDTVTGKWYHFNTPGGWQLIGNTIEEIAGCTAPAYTPGKGDSKVVINNCSPQPELYFYNGSAWVLVGGGSVYAGEGIRIENDTIILDSLYILRFRTGSNTDGAAGAMSWNATEETVELVTDQGAVTGHLMESAYYNTRNTTGSSIVVGTVVMANGTTGNTGRILIAPAIANGTVNSEYILGLAAQTIGNNSNGKVQHFGKVRGIQTNGANYGETWVDGDVLYCSAATPGYLTKVLPTAPNLKVPIAIVIHAHPSNGTLFVRPSHFPDLAQINDVELSSPTNGQVLTYNSTLSRWENTTPANQLQTLSTDGSAGNISISSGNTITLNVNDADASATNELQTLSVAANTATLSNSGGSVTIAGAGINTVGTAGTTITITGTEVDGSTTNELQTLSTGTNTLTLSNGGGTVTVDTDPADDVTGSGTSGQVSFWTGAQTQSGDNGFFWDNTNKRLGVNTAAPAFPLEVVGQSRIGGNFDVSANTPFFVTGSRSDRRITNTFTGSITNSVGYFAGTVDMRGSQAFTAFNGMTFAVNNQNTSASNNITAGNFTVTNDAANAGLSRGIGVVGRFVNSSNVAANDIRCVQGDASNLLAGNTISNLYLFRGEVASNAGAMTNTFGYYCGDITSGTQANTPYSFYAVDANAFNYFAGSTSIGTTTPAARLHVVGSGTSSSTWTAQFHNSAGNNNALMIRDDGNVGVGTSSPGARLQINTTGTTTGLALNVLNNSSQTGLSVADNGEVVIGYATGLRLGANRNSIGGIYSSGTSGQESVIFRSNAVPTVTNFVDVSFTNGQGDISITSGTRSLTAIERGFNPTSGNGVYNLLRIGGTINQTGTATGTTRGILIGPSINSAFDYRAIEYSNNSGWGIYGAGTAKSYFAGNVAIGTTTQNASAAFEVASTTQGVLFPRMTTVQRDLIATPADGLVIYNTTDNKLQVRAAGAWVDLH